jgi:hypothetical protein
MAVVPPRDQVWLGEGEGSIVTWRKEQRHRSCGILLPFAIRRRVKQTYTIRATVFVTRTEKQRAQLCVSVFIHVSASPFAEIDFYKA